MTSLALNNWALDQPEELHNLFRSSIGLDKSGYQLNIFLISPLNICCGYSLEVPSNESVRDIAGNLG